MISKATLLEVVKVLVIFVGFYFLQSQIFQIRYDIYGSRTQLAQAQENTQSELGDTQRFLQLALEDSNIELARAKRALEESVNNLKSEREALLRIIDERGRELETSLKDRVNREIEKVSTVTAVAKANSARLDRMSNVLVRESKLMKTSMLFPTLQLRGNGTVGSGVLIYSELQPGLAATPVYTTFALTAYHVVVEILGSHLDRDIDEVHVMREAESDSSLVFSARVVLFDKGKDIALLRLNTARRFPNLATLMPAGELMRLDIFSAAYAVGCPLGNRPLPTLGEISSKTKTVGDHVFWMLNAPTFFGNSGGGVYQASSFRLIGVSSMIYTYGKRNPTVVPHMGLFVPLATVYDWLNEEGFSFVHERRPIPEKLQWKLAFVRDGNSFERPISAAPASARSD